MEADAEFVGHWIDSREQTIPNRRYLRRTTQALAPARLPRHILTFQADRGVVSRVGGPTDSRVPREGRWYIERADPLRLRIEWGGGGEAAIFDIPRLAPDVMDVFVQQGSIE